jgi:hypothetical protein
MTGMIDFIRERFTRTKPLPAGNHFLRSAPDETPYRLHLRMQPDGSGILVVNAATILHLNPTATEFAYHMIKGSTPEDASRQIGSRYNINRSTALQDFVEFQDRIQTMIHTPDLDPVSYLSFDRVDPHSQTLTAPLRLDCALTYNLPPGADPSWTPTRRVDRELSTDEWKTILDKAWQAGIPHITLTGGEPTLRPDLAEIIAQAEKNGQVCGLLSDGLKLLDKGYLANLLQTGLDHLLFILQPDNNASWKALETILPEDLFTTVHLTVTIKNSGQVAQILKKLSELGVSSLSLSLADPSLNNSLDGYRELAAGLNLTLRWDLPVPYSSENPVAIETRDEALPTGSGKTWLYVEPDGDVLPAQGLADQVLGNFLRNSFEEIYH